MVVERKARYRAKLLECFATFKHALIIEIDFVGSRQLQQVRMATRGNAVIVLGKNTMIRSVLRQLAEEGNEKVANLLPLIKGNMGFIFSNGDLAELRKQVVSNKVPAAAKQGQLAIDDVIIPAGSTGLDPGQTSFFQALNVATKISRGSIEIMNPVHLITKGEKISASAVALLNKMGAKPFFFGISVNHVYEDGTVYGADILDLTDADMTRRFFNGVRMVAAISMQASFPTLAALPHMILNGFKKCLALSLGTEYTFEQAKIYKEMIADPSKFAAAGGGGGGDDAKAAPAAAAPAAAEESEEEEDGGFDLFD